jgi:hypothetical protein
MMKWFARLPDKVDQSNLVVRGLFYLVLMLGIAVTCPIWAPLWLAWITLNHLTAAMRD